MTTSLTVGPQGARNGRVFGSFGKLNAMGDTCQPVAYSLPSGWVKQANSHNATARGQTRRPACLRGILDATHVCYRSSL